MSPSILRPAKQTLLGEALMWSLVALAPKSAVYALHGTLYSPTGWSRPPQQHPSSSCPLSRDVMMGHIKGLLAKLGLNPSSYSRHSLHIGGATTATTAGLRDWEIKSLWCWKSNTYWMHIREMMDMKADCARRMAHTPASRAFNYSHPYPVKDKL